jgi:hypothetical protein
MPSDVFIKEANLMAQVSHHPNIAQIFDAGVSDDGRPYLIMEYYPNGNFQERARRDQLGIGEVLKIGIMIASAVETAHRAGILHRDIKPANILISAFDEPGLTDFGIASGHGPDEGAEGLSIPWSPPEVLNGQAGDARSDIYSLAATIFSLLEGRSPFEVPGGDNSELALMSRIEKNPLPQFRDTSLPASLGRVLANAMAKEPFNRPNSAAAFALELQAVQSELRMTPTKLSVISDTGVERSRKDAEDDDATRAKGVKTISPQAPTEIIDGVHSRPSPGVATPGRERSGMLDEPEVEATRHRTADPVPIEDAPPEEASAAKRLYIGAGAIAAAIVLGAVLVLTGGGGSDPTDDGASSNVDIYEVNDGLDGPVAVSPPAVAEIVAADNGNGTYTYTWEAPLPGLTYAVTPDGSATAEQIDVTTYETYVTCIQVEAIGDSGLISAATIGCVDE